MTSCFRFFVHEKHLIGNYYFIAVDTDKDMNLSYKLENGDYMGVAGSTVFAAGYNDDFIIVKQHPLPASRWMSTGM
jgi:hypothetical protein